MECALKAGCLSAPSKGVGIGGDLLPVALTSCGARGTVTLISFPQGGGRFALCHPDFLP